MEIITEPEFLETPVLIIDLAFLGGSKNISFFLRPTDTISIGDSIIQLTILQPTGKTEDVTIERRNLLWYSTVHTTIREKNPAFTKPPTEQPTTRPPVQSSPTVVGRSQVGTIPAIEKGTIEWPS